MSTKTDRPVKKKMKHSTYFNNDWMKNDNYSTWLKQTPGDPLYNTCSICSVKILVKHEGKTALDDHAKTKKHQSRIQVTRQTKAMVKYKLQVRLNFKLSCTEFKTLI